MDDSRERIFERAREIGRLVAQTPEYAYLKAARRELADDREATQLLNRLGEVQGQVLDHLDRNEEVSPALRQELEELQDKVQSRSRYQSLIASQANFEKLMDRVNQEIGKGIKAGEESRIIIPT